MKVEEILLKLLKEIVGDEEVSVNTKIGGNIINSINYVKLIVAIETEFDVEIPDEYLNISHFETVQDVAQFIQELLDK